MLARQANLEAQQFDDYQSSEAKPGDPNVWAQVVEEIKWYKEIDDKVRQKEAQYLMKKQQEIIEQQNLENNSRVANSDQKVVEGEEVDFTVETQSSFHDEKEHEMKQVNAEQDKAYSSRIPLAEIKDDQIETKETAPTTMSKNLNNLNQSHDSKTAAFERLYSYAQFYGERKRQKQFESELSRLEDEEK